MAHKSCTTDIDYGFVSDCIETRERFAGIKIFGLDMSGTISDDVSIAYEACKRVATKIGFAIEPTVEEWQKHPASTPHDDARRRRVVGDIPSDISDDQYVDMFKSELGQIMLNPGALIPIPRHAAVESIIGLASAGSEMGMSPPELFVASAIPHQVLEEDTKRFGIYKYMTRGVFGGCSDKAAIITDVLMHTGLKPRDAAYVGDTIGDIKAAKRANVFSIAVTGGYHSAEMLLAEKPDMLCDGLGMILWLYRMARSASTKASSPCISPPINESATNP